MLDSPDRLLEETIKEIATSNPVARRIINQTTLPQKVQQVEKSLEDADIPTDDGNPPSPPQNVDASEWPRALSVRWDEPVDLEYVVSTRVVLFKAGVQVRESLVRAQDSSVWLDGLDLTAYEIDVSFIDRWGHESSTTTVGPYTPEPTVADQISESVTVAAGQIVPNLGGDPSQFTDPDLFAEGVIELSAQAAAGRSNVLTHGTSLFDGFKLPSQTTVPGVPFTPSSISNGTVTFTDLPDGRWANWDNTIQPATFYPFAPQQFPGDTKYVAAIRVRNGGSAPVSCSVRVKVGTDATVAAQTLSGASQSIPADNQERTLFVAFDRGANTHHQIGLHTTTINTALRVSRLQLAPIPPDRNLNTVTEAPPFAMPILSADGISARLLTAWDVVAGRAIIEDATIDNALISNLAVTSAKVDEMSVTKLTAGFLDVTMDLILGGSITWDGGQLNDFGVELSDVAEGSSAPPNAGRASKITSPATGSNPTPWGALNFFSNDSTPSRGVSIWADGGAATNRVGQVKIVATNGSQNEGANTSARIVLRSVNNGLARIDIDSDTYFSGSIDVTGGGAFGGALTTGGTFRATGDADFRGVLEHSPSGDGPRIKPTVALLYTSVSAGGIVNTTNGRITNRGVWSGYMLNPSNSRWEFVPGVIKDVADNGEPRLENTASGVRNLMARGLSA